MRQRILRSVGSQKILARLLGKAYFAVDLNSAEVDHHYDDDEHRIPNSRIDAVIPEIDQSCCCCQLSRCCYSHGVPEVPPSSNAERWLYESSGMSDETSSNGHES